MSALDSAAAVKSDERAPLIDAMEAAALRLRDAELAVQQARDAYAQAINEFTRFVTGGGQ